MEVPGVTVRLQCETLTSERAVRNSLHVADGRVNRGESWRSSRHLVVGRAHRSPTHEGRERARAGSGEAAQPALAKGARLSESSCEHLKIVSSLHAADTPLMTTGVGVISEHRAKALESRQCDSAASRSSDIVIAHTTLIEAHPTVPGTNARSKCPGAARIVRKKEDVRPHLNLQRRLGLGEMARPRGDRTHPITLAKFPVHPK